MTAGPFTTALDAVIEETLDTFHVPGASIAIIEGSNVYTKAYGLAKLPSTKASSETLFFIGSLTKSFLAATWTKYIQSEENQKTEHPVVIDTPIGDIIGDDFVLPDEWATKHVTLEDCMSHRTGSSRHDNAIRGPDNSPRKVTRALRYLPLHREPRVAMEYVNSMFTVATHALETASGKSFDQLVHKEILTPLDMEDTHTSSARAAPHFHGNVRLYQGYSWSGDWNTGKGKFVDNLYGDEAGLVGAAGCIISNVHDMAKYIQALLGQSKHILNQEILDDMTKPRILMSKVDFPTDKNSYMHYALGLWRYCYRGIEIVQHTGDVIGYSSLLAFLPSQNWGFVLLSNGDFGSSAAERILFYLLDTMLNTPSSERHNPTQSSLSSIRAFTTRPALADLIAKHYPTTPSPPLPSPLPLSAHTGKFYHPAYGPLTLTLSPEPHPSAPSHGPYLVGRLTNASDILLQLFHVTGEYWIGYKLRDNIEIAGQGIMSFKAMPRIGPGGKVETWGLGVETDLESVRGSWRQALIWFDAEE